MTNDELRAWDNDETDINNALHLHFQNWGRWDWCDIADEALRIHNVMFGEAAEKNSAIAAITAAAAAHASNMAYEAMAAALGFDATALRIAVATWSENQDNLPPPVGAARLMEMVVETNNEIESHAQRIDILPRCE